MASMNKTVARAAINGLQQGPTESKAEYLERLSDLVDAGKLAGVTAELLACPDARVRLRTLEWIGRVAGWVGPEALGVGPELHQHLHLHGDRVDALLSTAEGRKAALERAREARNGEP